MQSNTEIKDNNVGYGLIGGFASVYIGLAVCAHARLDVALTPVDPICLR